MTEAKTSGDATAGFATPDFRPISLGAGSGHTFTMLGTTMRLIGTAAGTGERYTVIEQVTPAGWGLPRHIHSREDEIFYILEGTYELHVGDERRTISTGASAIFPRHVPHGFRNAGSTPGRLLSIITPGGLEEYFLAVAKMFGTAQSCAVGRIGTTVRSNSAAARSLNQIRSDLAQEHYLLVPTYVEA